MSDPEGAEERLRDAIRAHDDAAREAPAARGDAKAARRDAKAAGQAFVQRHRLVVQNAYGGWAEGLALVVLPAVGAALGWPSGIAPIGALVGFVAAVVYLTLVVERVGGVVGHLRLARERRRIDASPFPIHGWFAALEPPWSRDHREITLTVTFDDAVDKDLLRGALRTQGAKSEVQAQDRVATVRSEPIATTLSGKGASRARDNADVHAWQLAVLAALEALHAARRIVEVKVDG